MTDLLPPVVPWGQLAQGRSIGNLLGPLQRPFGQTPIFQFLQPPGTPADEVDLIPGVGPAFPQLGIFGAKLRDGHLLQSGNFLVDVERHGLLPVSGWETFTLPAGSKSS